MNVWIHGLQVAAIGIMVVFAGLVLLIACVTLIKAFSVKETPKKAVLAEVPAPVAAAPQVQAAPLVYQGEDPQVVAAITAALSVMLAPQPKASVPTGGFIVRRIKRT